MRVSGINANNWDFLVPTGTANPTTHDVTNLQVGYITYLKNGKIWKVDATTLATTQVSNMAGITPASVCEMNLLTNMTVPLTSIIQLRLAGADGTCDTGDEIVRIVKLGMSPSTAPIAMDGKSVDEILIDGRLIVRDYTTTPFKVQRCSANLATCVDVTTFTNGSGMEGAIPSIDAKYILFRFDEKLKLYAYTAAASATNPATLYTPAPDEVIAENIVLAGDGTVYFATYKTAAPYDSAIRRVAADGTGLTTLASFTTNYALELGIVNTPTHIGYYYPTAAMNTMILASVPKAGGPVTTLSSTVVAGEIVGEYLFFEDTSGKVSKVHFDGSGLQVKANAQLSGGAYGGSTNLDIGFNPQPASVADSRVLVTDIGNRMRSYAAADDIGDPAAGTLLGTVPVNLSNPRCAGAGDAVLCTAERRNTGMSFGADTILIDTARAASLKRMTNTNGAERALDIDADD